MSRIRRTPPLFEAVGSAPRNSGASTPAGPVVHAPSAAVARPAAAAAPPAPRQPVVVTAARPRPPRPREAPSGRLTPLMLMAAAALVLVGFVAWSVGYSRGENAGKRSMLAHTTPEDAAVIAGKGPLAVPQSVLPPKDGGGAFSNRPAAAPANPAPSSAPATPPTPAPSREPERAAVSAKMPPVSGPDPRQPANNYLEICRLTWRDAEAAAKFLQQNSVPAVCVPLNGVDPAKAQANNGLHLVLVLDGIPSGQYRANEAKRAELKATVQKLGKRWQREEHGASDFGDPNWVLFKGGN